MDNLIALKIRWMKACFLVAAITDNEIKKIRLEIIVFFFLVSKLATSHIMFWNFSKLLHDLRLVVCAIQVFRNDEFRNTGIPTPLFLFLSEKIWLTFVFDHFRL